MNADKNLEFLMIKIFEQILQQIKMRQNYKHRNKTYEIILRQKKPKTNSKQLMKTIVQGDRQY